MTAVRALAVLLLLPGERPTSSTDEKGWVELAQSGASGYVYSAMIYVPSRREVLHWGAVSRRGTARNDVRALDIDSGRWVSDYVPADPEELSRGVWNRGRGTMRACGTPAPSSIVHGVCWDSRRKRLVYVMKGLMATYDPRTRKWSEISTETELNGTWAVWPDKPYAFYERGLRPERDFHEERIEGPPPVYGPSICYDPVNDEILLFPHWGWQNPDLREATGRVSGHAGTFLYSFEDNLWRRRSPELGSPAIREARERAIESMGRLSRMLDRQWARRETLDRALLEELARGFPDGFETEVIYTLTVER